MTPQERAGGRWGDEHWGREESAWIEREIGIAIAEEREACAKLAQWPEPVMYLPGPAVNGQASLCDGIAAAIRMRS